MRSPRRPDPPPLQTNDRLIAAAGTAAWAVALAVLLVVGLPEDARWWLWVCVCGIVSGLFGYWYLPRLHRARAAQARRGAPLTAPAGQPPVAPVGEPPVARPEPGDLREHSATATPEDP
ncbi:DUF2530 domain-containing protein [Thermomonospora amylolytica]|uniref:DUF2530 domain-containing protein n=1 Tax=Thermomonospora amylolytica TaxID=1411117 RepID=UPI000E6D15BF|nr:DUF2530 domain-containing protein [Thermomonospora amylolytica]